MTVFIGSEKYYSSGEKPKLFHLLFFFQSGKEKCGGIGKLFRKQTDL